MNCVCWGTHYQMFQKIPTGKRKPHQVWRAFCRSWLRVFGVPEVMVLDEGREFMAEFADRASPAGSPGSARGREVTLEECQDGAARGGT